MNEMKYPWQVKAVRRKNKTLGADAQLFLPTEKENVSPLEIHSGFSRFVISIIDKQLENDAIKVPRANIPANDVPFIFRKTKIAMEKDFANSDTNKVESNSDFGTSVAYTQKLTDKKFKGKTPAEVLLENPANKDELLRIKDWLTANLAKYKGNKYQIDAIDDAIALFEIGELSGETVQPEMQSNVITIYKSENKYMSQKDDGGNNLIYQISIVFDAGRKYPYVLNIMNCFAPVVDGEGGQKNIIMSSATNSVKSSFSMTENEWYTFIDRMYTTTKNFENMNFATQFDVAKSNSYQH